MAREQDEAAIGEVIAAWAAAVRRRDLPAILENHGADIVMFDVPPPFQIRGIEAYEASWAQFFSWTDQPIPFDIAEMSITAGEDVAFVVATLHCAEPAEDGRPKPLEFRLTVGLRKLAGRWTITHEHHSVPSGS
jgi:ketosteroid isomerase-like protein